MDPLYSKTIPSELVTHVTETLGEQGRQWLRELPAIVGRLAAEHSMTVEEPFAAGEFNFVAPAMRGDEPVVIKAAPPFENGEFLSEAAWLERRNGRGSVRLLHVDRELGIMILERALPGKSLAEGFKGNESGLVDNACTVLSSIRMAPPTDTEDVIVLDDWFSNLERAAGTPFPSEYVEKALGYYHDLSARSSLLYLHGDFHPGNIVTATREPFLAIDPKGIIGPLGYDIAVFLNNLYWGQGDDIDHAGVKEMLAVSIDKFSCAFDIPGLDLRQWAYAVQVLGAFWTFDEMPALYSGGVVKADIWEV